MQRKSPITRPSRVRVTSASQTWVVRPTWTILASERSSSAAVALASRLALSSDGRETAGVLGQRGAATVARARVGKRDDGAGVDEARLQEQLGPQFQDRGLTRPGATSATEMPSSSASVPMPELLEVSAPAIPRQRVE